MSFASKIFKTALCNFLAMAINDGDVCHGDRPPLEETHHHNNNGNKRSAAEMTGAAEKIAAMGRAEQPWKWEDAAGVPQPAANGPPHSEPPTYTDLVKVQHKSLQKTDFPKFSNFSRSDNNRIFAINNVTLGFSPFDRPKIENEKFLKLWHARN